MYQISIRFFVMLVLILAGAQLASAQDKIYLTDGSMVEAKVKEINNKNVVYRRWDNQEGTDYVLLRKEVNRIVYQNGTEERLLARHQRSFPGPGRREVADDNEGEHETLHTGKQTLAAAGYGSNILAIAPLQMTNESAAGVGIHYEHMIDKSGIFSFYLPIAFSFYDDNTGNGTVPQTTTRVITSLYPGIKAYPAGSGHRVAYSVGPSLGFGFGTKNKETRTYDPGSGSTIVSYKESSFFKTGFMVNNGLNIQPTKSLYIGLEFGIGILYYNNESTNYTIGDEPIVQFNFKMGYRF